MSSEKSPGRPSQALSRQIGQRLASALGERHSRSELAQALGTSPANVSRYLSGARPMPLSFLAAAAEYLDLSADWLIFGRGPIYAHEPDWSRISDLDLEMEKTRLEVERLRRGGGSRGARDEQIRRRIEKLEQLLSLQTQLRRETPAAEEAPSKTDEGQAGPPERDERADRLRRRFAEEAKGRLAQAVQQAGMASGDYRVSHLAEASFAIYEVEQLPEDWPERFVPIIGRLAAGTDLTSTRPQEPRAVAHRYLRYEGAPRGAFALEIQGDSMAPHYHHGDMVIVDTSRRASEGICAVVTRHGRERIARLKRLRIEGDTAVLESLNERYAPVRLARGAVEAFALWRHLPYLRLRPAE